MKWEDQIAAGSFALTIGVFLIILIQSWSKHARRKSLHQEPGGTKTEFVHRESVLKSITKQVTAAVIVLGIILGVVIIGWPFIASIAAVLVAAVVLLVCWVWLIRRRRMRCSPEGAAALTRLVAELRPQLLAGNQGVLEVEGVWAFDYPKVLVLFESDHALEQAKTGGLLSQLAGKVTEAVRNDLAFGQNRESFDPKQAVWATAERQYWDAVLNTRN